MNITTDHETTESIEAPARLDIRSNKDYRYSPATKPSSGSFLRIKSDGTVAYHNPECLKYNAPGSKPFRMPALKAREESSTKTFERLKASIDKRASRDPSRNMERFTGRPCMPGWYIVATDGHRALLGRGEGTGERVPTFDKLQETAHIVCSIDDPEFHLALKRALVMTEENQSKVRLIGCPGLLALSSAHGEPYGQRDGNDAGDFEETLTVNSGSNWRVAIDANFVEPACGSWPLVVWHSDQDSAVMFEPQDSSWRYVVMPIRDDWKTFEISNDASPESETNPEILAVPEEKLPCAEHEYDDATMSEVPACIRCGQDAPLSKYLAISYDTDEQRTHFDFILAASQSHALERIADLRPDAQPVSVMLADSLRVLADELDARLTVDIEASTERLQEEAQS